MFTPIKSIKISFINSLTHKILVFTSYQYVIWSPFKKHFFLICHWKLTLLWFDKMVTKISHFRKWWPIYFGCTNLFFRQSLEVYVSLWSFCNTKKVYMSLQDIVWSFQTQKWVYIFWKKSLCDHFKKKEGLCNHFLKLRGRWCLFYWMENMNIISWHLYFYKSKRIKGLDFIV